MREDKIKRETTKFVIGIWTKGVILQECETISQAKLMIERNPFLDKRICIYTSEEWISNIR